MRYETGHESHVLIFLNASLTFPGFSLSVLINQQRTKQSRLSYLFQWRWMRKTVLHTAVLCWLMEMFSTVDSAKNVTGTTSSLGLRFLDFQNKLWRIILKWGFCMPVSNSPPHLCSHSACMPSITSYHTPLWVCIASHHIFRNPIIKRSS